MADRGLISQALPRLSFRLPLDPAHLLRARHRIRDYLRGGGVKPEDVEAIVLSLEEAMSNAVRHSRAEQDLEIRLRVEGRDLLAEVRDCGQGFDTASFDPEKTPDLMALGGRGLYLMGQLMDDLELRCDGGLEVRLVKRDVVATASKPSLRRSLESTIFSAQAYRDERQRAILEELDEGFVALDWEYRFLYANSSAERFLGRSALDLVGHTLWDLLPYATEHPAIRPYREAMELGRASTFEYESPAAACWTEARVYPIPSGITVYFRDIEERKQREEERRRLAELLVHMSDATIVLDQEWRYVSVNDKMLELSGLERDQLIGKVIWDVFPAACGTEFERVVRDAMERRVTATFEAPSVVYDGWNEIRLYPTSDGLALFYHEVTERKRAAEALAESERRFRALFDNSPDAVFLTVPDASVLAANPAACRMFGYCEAELRDLRRYTLFDTEDARFSAGLEERRREGRLRAWELTAIRKCGERFPVEVDTVVLPTEPAQSFVVVRDVSERKRREGEQHLLVELADDCAHLSTEDEILHALRRHLGKYLGTAEVLFTEIDVEQASPTGSRWGIGGIADPGPPFGLSEPLIEEFDRLARVGESMVVRDTQADSRADPGACASLGIKAFVTVPLGQGDGSRHLFTVTDSTPRDWTEDDVRLIQAVAGGAFPRLLRARAVETLQSSEELLRAVTDNSSDAIYVKDTDSRWVMANPAVLLIVGRTAEEALGKTDRELYDDPAIGEEILANDRRIMETGEAEVFEEVADTPQGRRTFMSVKAPRKDANGKTIGIVGISHDITDRKRAEEALRESEEQANLLVAHAPAAIYEIDFRGPRFSRVNDFMCEYSGYSREELLALDPFELIVEEDRLKFAERIRATAAGAPIPATVEYRCRTKQGEVRWAVLNTTLTCEDGVPVGAFVVGHDVTERKRLELEREQVNTSVGAVNRIIEAALTCKTEEELGRACLAVVEQATGSRFGFIGEIGRDGLLHDIAISDPGRSQCTMDEQTGHRLLPGPFRLRGLYGRVLSDGVTLLTNSPSDHPDSIGAPPGHPTLTAFLGVPLKAGHRTVGLIALGNRDSGFDEEQKELVERLAPSIAQAFERKRAEEALRESEQKYRNLFEHMDEGFALGELVRDEDGRVVNYRYLELNPALEKLTGLRHSEVAGRLITDVYPGLYSWWVETYGQVVESGEQAHFETWFEQLQRWYDVRVFPRGVDEFSVLYDDITGRKQAEKALRESERRYRGIVEVAEEGIATHDHDGTITYVNERMAQMLGYSREELVGRSSLDFVDDTERKKVIEARESLKEEGSFTTERKMRRRDGSILWTLSNVAPQRDDAGDFFGYLAMHTDITERKLAEEALRASEQTFRILFDSSLEAVFLSRPDGTIEAANPAACRMYGYSEDELRALGRDAIMDRDDPRLQAGLAERARDGMVHNLEVIGVRKSGERFPIEVDSVILSGEPPRSFMTHRDITERKGAERSLNEAVRLAGALSDVDRVIHSTLDTEDLVTAALSAATHALGADAALITFHHDKAFRIQHVYGWPDELVGRVVPDRLDKHGVLALRSAETLAVDDALSDVRVGRKLVKEFGVKSLLVAPLIKQGEAFGCLIIDYTEQPHRFTQAEVDFGNRLASSVSLAIENAERYREIRGIATVLQQNMLHPLPKVDGVELAVVSQPAFEPELVGGDFHDVMALSDDLVVIVIGDVAGKGIKAAGMTETVRSAIRALALISPSPEYIMRHVNDLLSFEPEATQFVTALLVMLDLNSGQAFISSAGHPPPVFISDENVSSVDLPFGPPLGAFTDDFRAIRLSLLPGDTLVMFTDGVTEARVGSQLFGEERVRDAVRELGTKDLDRLVRGLLEATIDYAGRLRDDVQILAVKLTK